MLGFWANATVTETKHATTIKVILLNIFIVIKVLNVIDELNSGIKIGIIVENASILASYFTPY